MSERAAVSATSIPNAVIVTSIFFIVQASFPLRSHQREHFHFTESSCIPATLVFMKGNLHANIWAPLFQDISQEASRTPMQESHSSRGAMHNLHTSGCSGYGA